MRVLLRGMNAGDIEGELVRGGFIDPDTGKFDLEETFSVRCDDGAVVEVHGWMVDIIQVEDTCGPVMLVWRNELKARCIVPVGERRFWPTAFVRAATT